MLELKKQGKLEKSSVDMFNDVRTCIIKNYIHYDTKECHKISDFGHFFPEMVKNVSKYIQKRDDFRQILIKLREKGKGIFIATNSHAEYTNMIMTQSIGEDWMSLVDFTSSHCGKPVYFKDLDGSRKFYRCDFEEKTLKGAE